jgi:uncharacterized damage-inducible protein DinB
MFLTVKQFNDAWKQESDGTRKIMAALTDAGLNQKVTDDHRTLGRMAWHIALTLGELGGGLGLKVDCPKEDTPVPTSAKTIAETYDKAAASLAKSVANDWNDAKLQEEIDMYGQKFTLGYGLWMALVHEIHHRAQMTVLMRQAGLKVPGLYGPSYDEWGQYGGKPPAI